ncbi:CD9 antigen-like [Pomacea canaliculata]|uniref:CD9 antigen-like n=1 Tax=Pomacea canaliculata TaxID=400727 RepID=UPI000D73B2E0|nr:CD9 antigen-like [Pomacea canaliculata]
MALGSCYACIKYLMFAFNLLFWLLGCAILGVGIWLRVDPNVAKYVNQAEEINVFFTLAYILMAIGIIIMVIGFLGCCGAIRESQCMLGAFFLLLFIIFAILLGAGIWAVVEKDTVIRDYETNEQSASFMDGIQQTFDCCGSKIGAKDYDRYDSVPKSCIAENYDKPCEKEFFNWIAEHLIVVAGVAIAIAIVLILGMIFSMVLCCAIRYTVAQDY